MPVDPVIARWAKLGEPMLSTTRHLHHEFCAQMLELLYHLEALYFFRDDEIIDVAVIEEVTDDVRKIHSWLVYWMNQGLVDEIPRDDFARRVDRALDVQPEMLSATRIRQSLAEFAADGLPGSVRLAVDNVEHGGFALNRPATRAMDMLIFQAALSFVRIEFEDEFLDIDLASDDSDFALTDENMFVRGYNYDLNGEPEVRDGRQVTYFNVHPFIRPLQNAQGDEAEVVRIFRRLACNLEDEEHFRTYCNDEVGTLDRDDQSYLLHRITNLLGARAAGGLFTPRRYP